MSLSGYSHANARQRRAAPPTGPAINRLVTPAHGGNIPYSRTVRTNPYPRRNASATVTPAFFTVQRKARPNTVATNPHLLPGVPKRSRARSVAPTSTTSRPRRPDGCSLDKVLDIYAEKNRCEKGRGERTEKGLIVFPGRNTRAASNPMRLGGGSDTTTRRMGTFTRGQSLEPANTVRAPANPAAPHVRTSRSLPAKWSQSSAGKLARHAPQAS